MSKEGIDPSSQAFSNGSYFEHLIDYRRQQILKGPQYHKEH